MRRIASSCLFVRTLPSELPASERSFKCHQGQLPLWRSPRRVAPV